tara:strand:- start:146 stop:541 length:396 start_codon:yes stop_codon:yes gene_type:complete
MDNKTETAEQAILDMQVALEQHGMPTALCHVPIRVRNLIPAETLREMLATARTAVQPAVKIDDIKQPLNVWCDANPYVVVTTRQLSEIAGCSQNVARKFVADNPHRFKRIDQYKHEVRNYVEERARDKATA